jgi:NTE family protein
MPRERYLRFRYRGFATDLKSSLAVSQRAFELGMYFSSRRKFHECDVLLCPEELSSFGTFDTKHLEQILEMGYAATIARMDEILATLDQKLKLRE